MVLDFKRDTPELSKINKTLSTKSSMKKCQFDNSTQQLNKHSKSI